MRKLIMWNMVTLDGFFEGPEKGQIEWHDVVWGEELEQLSLEQLRSAGMLLFGRVTYEGMASYWPSATGEVADLMNTIPKIIFSRTLRDAKWGNTRLVTTNAQDEVATLKRQSGKDLFIFGSADLSSTFIRYGLIDEFRLGLTPVVLGDGIPLFKSGTNLQMKPLEVRHLKSGCVFLRYEPKQEH
jgi:dihydrofolate reductase